MRENRYCAYTKSLCDIEYKLMAYLTEYSFRQLINQVDIKETDRINRAFFKTNIFDNDYLFYFFNQFELKYLFKKKLFYSGAASESQLVYQKVPKRSDNSNYILKIEGKVKYHKDNLCKALNYGFKNFFIPEPIARLREKQPERHEFLVEEIRKWFETNNYSVSRYLNDEINDKTLTKAFNSKFPEEYEVDPIIISSTEKGQFEWYIEKKSSGNIELEESFDNNFFLSKVSELIKKREYICNSNTMKNLSKYDFLINRTDSQIRDYIINAIRMEYLREVEEVFIENYGLEKLKDFWNKHRTLKSQAISLISDYYKWTFNFDENSFDEILLEKYNLEPCRQCYQN